METAAFEALKSRLAPESEQVEIRDISQQEMDALTMEQAQELVALYGSNLLINLPEREKKFFDWLRDADQAVWEDLWGVDPDDGYRVSLSHLPNLLPKQRGFPICDLVENSNFYFSRGEITEGEGQLHLDSALDLVRESGKLSADQAFLVEVWRAPIDQWRFAYMYGLPLADVKHMVAWLIQEGVLHAPPQREEDDPDRPMIEVTPHENGNALLTDDTEG